MSTTQLQLSGLGSSTNNNTNKQRKMNLLAFSLPDERHVKSILEANELPFQIPTNNYRSSYNCWGYVAFNYGWEHDAVWLRAEVMDNHLSNHTIPITKEEATTGDIAVFRRGDGGLEHTALLTHEPEIICHKPGAGELCVDTMDRATSMYGGVVTYVRPIKVDSFGEKV